MQIKEVEQLTGLTAKAIRLYENEQLITVHRRDNLYRDYNDNTVKQLLEIKLYRKFGVKISDLKRWKTGEVNIEDLLSECLSSYEKEEKNISNKTDLCRKLLSKIKAGYEVETESYLASFEILESDEFDQLEKSIDELNRGSVFSQFFFSLIYLGPIGWLFLNYYGLKDYNALAINIPLAVCSTIILSVSWTNFLRVRNCSVKNILKGIGKLLLCVIAFVVLIAGVISVLALVGYSAESLFIPKEYLLYTMRPGALVAVIFFLLEFVCLYLLIIDFISNKKGNRTIGILKPFFKKLWHVLIALNLAMFYFISTSLFIVTSDKIINRSIFNPIGNEYTYSDIDTIRTGVDDGVFYYELVMINGDIFDLTELGIMCGTVDFDDEYSYLVKIDKIAMNAGAVKIISEGDINQIDYNRSSIKEIFNNK